MHSTKIRKTAAVVAAAGRGRRLGALQPKAFLPLGNRPLYLHCLKVLNNSPDINEIILVVPKGNLRSVKAQVPQSKFRKLKRIVAGGPTRSASVYEGLKAVSSHTDYVIIHDGARPFLTQQLIKDTLSKARRFGAAVAGVPVNFTVKEVDSNLNVKLTLRRNRLWEVQTPQAFKKDLITEAYQRALRDKISAVDDASLVERLGKEVKIVWGSYNNIKITTPEDLILAEALMGINVPGLRKSA
jgi:2-C-methyl-D-erythritol 4-phosphate cytidylyltransferase